MIKLTWLAESPDHSYVIVVGMRQGGTAIDEYQGYVMKVNAETGRGHHLVFEQLLEFCNYCKCSSNRFFSFLSAYNMMLIFIGHLTEMDFGYP